MDSKRDEITDAVIIGETTQEKPKRKRTDILTRQAPKKQNKPATLIAYDFETTRIQPGTPKPLYITAYHEKLGFSLEMAIKDMAHLRWILETYFLTEEFQDCKFVAWNANNFDVYFVAAALVADPENKWIMRPYMSGSKSVRGLKIMRFADYDPDDDEANRHVAAWEFVDGMAQLGLVGVSLDKFLSNFAPNHQKLKGVIDFENGEEFDATNQNHCDYAMRDSVGLYHAINNAQSIILDRFNQPLRVTMGAVCIRILVANLPADVKIYKPADSLRDVVKQYVMRGGYCYCVKPFHGKVWKYDLNQAYAAAMRDARLPAGRAFHSVGRIHPAAVAYVARITAEHVGNFVPFYCRTGHDGKFTSVFERNRISDTWICASEYEQLVSEGWRINVIESWFWESNFNMRDYVDGLERGRMSAEGGPSGPIGTTYKNIGNHSYGKTVEDIEPVEYVIAKEPPTGFVPHYADGQTEDPLDHVFYRLIDPIEKNYHQPQIGAFITAHVRMVLRRAALLDPEAWLYADTDCVVFSRDIADELDIHPSRYGAWKIEAAGVEHKIIAKKVYLDTQSGKGHAKGMRVKELTTDHFDEWFAGTPPVQEQTHRNNFLAVLEGAEMFRAQTRTGTIADPVKRKAAQKANAKRQREKKRAKTLSDRAAAAQAPDHSTQTFGVS